MQHCPPREVLRQILVGDMADAEARALDDHLQECESCRRTLDEVSDDPELRSWKGALPPENERPSVEWCLDLADRILRDLPVVETHLATDASTERSSAHRLFLALQPGSRLGPFELLQEIGRGGMGVVYKARDVELDRIVALKAVPFDDADGKARARFVREARSAASVKHDHVVALHVVNMTADGVSYLVMEYVQGPTLREWIKSRGPLPPTTAAEILAQAASGLQAIHDAGVIHCDVKSSNIMLDEPTREASMPTAVRAKVTDFGLARLTTAERTMTLDGMLAGTPHYMSPEQLRGEKEVDPRSDVYSLGVTLYESLTGTVPFSGTPQMVMRQIDQVEPRRPSALNDAVPGDLETICLKAMAKHPARRYSSAKEFSEDLQRWLHGEPILARPVGSVERLWRWGQRNPRIALLSSAVLTLLICLTVVSSVSALWIAAEQRQTKRQEIAALKAERQAKEHAANATRALEHADSQATRAGKQRDLALEAHLHLVGGVQDRLADTPGTLALRKELLESAAEGLEKIVSQSGASNESDRGLFLAHQRLGEAYQVLGRTEDARRELERAKSIAETRYAQQPDDRTAKEDVAVGLISLGEFQLKALDFKAARSSLQEAQQLLDGLASKTSVESAISNLRIQVLGDLGDVALRLGDNSAGENHYQQALSLSAELKSKEILSASNRRVMDSVLRRLGDAALLRGEMGKGVEYYRQALRSAEEAGLEKISLRERHGLVDAYGRLGLVLAWLGEADEAEACFRKGLDLNEQAARAEPENLLLTRKSAIIHQRFGDVSWSRGEYDAARQHLLKALDLHRQLAKRDPGSIPTQNDLVVCLEQLGRLETRVEQYAQADAWYEQALTILRARKKAGTLTDPISIGFEQSMPVIQDILRRFPAALDAPVPDDVSPQIAAAILGERAAVVARKGNRAGAEAELALIAKRLPELTAAEQANLQLGIARIYALCARSLKTENSEEKLSAANKEELQRYQSEGVSALEKFIAADPFNATYLGFEFELRALHSNPRFQQLAAKFRDPRKS